jgi:glycerol kinase
LLNALIKDYPAGIRALKADGGAAENTLMLQFQADISELEISRGGQLETTALGAAYLAGLGVSFWNEDELHKLNGKGDIFNPNMDPQRRMELLAKWKKAISRSLGWENEE